MSNLINGLLERRSIREYEDKPVPKDILELIVKAGAHAPSGMDEQPWHFTVIQNAGAIGRITDTLKKTCRSEGIPDFVAALVDNPAYTVNYGAPVFIIVSGDRASALSIFDCTLAAGNIMNASYALGLGSCWIHTPTLFAGAPEFRALLSELGVPSEYDVCASICLGYPAGPHPRPTERKANTENYVD